MRINTNVSAINTLRINRQNTEMKSKVLEKLSSGLRINKSADDAAGLSISEKMRGQIRGLNKAQDNIQQGISLIQTADGGLNQIHEMLQRGRELSVQAANETLKTIDKEKIQEEIDQLVAQIDFTATNTEFNGVKPLNSEASSDEILVVAGLQTGGWLSLATDRITSAYGLTADNSDLIIKFEHGSAGGVMAYVSGTVAGDGKTENMELVLDLTDFVPVNDDNGGTWPMYADRVIAHEMVHAVMGRTMNFASLDTWIKEGTAEFIHGADERLTVDLAGESDDAGALISNNSISGPWASDSAHYSTSYAAIRYLHQKGLDNGTQGVKTFLTRLAAGDSVDVAINITTGYFDKADFISEFEGGNGEIYIDDLRTSGKLSNVDTGAIGGADADGNAALSAEDIINESTGFATWTADTTDTSYNALTDFNATWEYDGLGEEMSFLVGANASSKIDFSLVSVKSSDIGLTGVDVVADPDSAITSFNDAIKSVSTKRGKLGAMQNRLEYTSKVCSTQSENMTSSESQIRDADMATEMMENVKLDILMQASQSMFSQANQKNQSVLKLIA